MTPTAIIATGVVGWLVVISLILAFFFGAKWVDRAVDEEMNLIAPAPWPKQ